MASHLNYLYKVRGYTIVTIKEKAKLMSTDLARCRNSVYSDLVVYCCWCSSLVALLWLGGDVLGECAGDHSLLQDISLPLLLHVSQLQEPATVIRVVLQPVWVEEMGKEPFH